MLLYVYKFKVPARIFFNCLLQGLVSGLEFSAAWGADQGPSGLRRGKGLFFLTTK